MTSTSLRKIRKRASLTQSELASRCSLTRGYVLRAEQGLYETPSPKLLSYLATVAECSEEELLLQYHRDRKEHRVKAGPPVADVIKRLKAVQPPNLKLSQLRRLLNCNTVIKFCVLLCLNPAIVDRFERSGGDTGFLRNALLDAELAPEEVDWLCRLLS